MENFDIHRFFKILYSKKIYVTFIITLCLAMGYFYSYYYLTPMYKSSATIVLVKNTDLSNSDSDSISQKDIALNQNLLSTYTKIAKSYTVAKQVIDNLGLTISEQQLLNSISIQSVNNTEVFKVYVSNSDSNLAATIANELVTVFSNEVKDLYNMNNVYIMDNAEPTSIPYNINHIKDLSIFIMFGVVLSFGLVICIYFFDNTIKSEQDIEDYALLSVLSSIPLYNKDKENVFSDLIVNEKPKSPVAECFKTFRTNIMFSIQNKELNTILVTSGSMSEGKSFVSSNLAVTFAQSGKNVILVDTDMRKGRQHKIFSVSNKNGLSNCLSDIAIKGSSVNINDYVKETKIPNLHIMTSGNVPPNPSELLSSPNMKKFLKALNSQYDIVICDGTPCMLVSDSVILSKIVDTTVIVTSNRQTKLNTLLQIKKSIDMVGGHIGGVVINKMQVDAKEYKNQYYYGDISSINSSFEYSGNNNSVLQNSLNISENYIDDVHEEASESSNIVTNDSIKDISNVNFELSTEVDSIRSDVKEIKKLYKNLIKNNINSLEQKDNNFNSIIAEIDGIKDLYNSIVDKQSEQMESLNDKINDVKLADNSSLVLDELNNIKDLYDSMVDRQAKQMKDLNDKINGIKFTDNSDIVLDEINNIRGLYSSMVDRQAKQIENLNDKINGIKFTDNSDIVLKEMANIYKYLDNINNRFTYLEEKAKNNESLIKQLSKDSLKPNFNNRYIDINKINNKVIQIQDYLEDNFIKNDTDNYKKTIKKAKHILDGQINLLDDLIEKPIEKQVSTIEKITNEEPAKTYVVDYEKVANKRKKVFNLFKAKDDIDEYEDPINVVSQILREGVV